MTLDGALVCRDSAGQPDFARLRRRLSASKSERSTRTLADLR